MEQVIGRPFQPGQSGNPAGRPKGSRHRLSEAALAALCEDFEASGREAIERCRREDPGAYLRVVTSLLPKQILNEHMGEGGGPLLTALTVNFVKPGSIENEAE
jgi:hypothetical protein